MYYSTNSPGQDVSLAFAVVKGLAADNGLFMPRRLPRLPQEFFSRLPRLSLAQIGFEVSKALFEGEIPEPELEALVEDALDFDTPLVPLDDDRHVLELWHGPTLAFKDVGARFMARLLAYFNRGQQRVVRILVATSGDTGSAVASGFLKVPGIEVVLLYPKGGVSKIQEAQLTTMGHNIEALEVEGVFDDCQRLVKQAFLDPELNRALFLTSANSINIARLIPQSFYYFRALAQLPDSARPTVVSVPSGNFGNLTGGLIAQRMGLPIGRFIVATNANKVVPEYLETGVYQARPTLPTLSNAMDVGDPSNFARLLDLFGGKVEAMRAQLSGHWSTDEQTRRRMKEIHQRYGYVIDPHGAVAYDGLAEGLRPGERGILLGTAHPAKFKDAVDQTLGLELPLPERLAHSMALPKVATPLSKDFADFRAYLMRKA